MEKSLQNKSQGTGTIPFIRFSKGLGWGLIGGAVGTLIMDLVLMGAFAIARLPLLACFSIVGDTVATIFSIQSIENSRAIRLGVLTHYLIGPVIGAIFGTVIMRVKALQVNTIKKSVLLAILYVEILSQPLLASTPILLKMALPAILQWYCGALGMHLIAGAVIGAVVGHGLRLQKNKSMHQISS